MNLNAAKILVAVAFGMFVVATILFAVSESLGLPPEGWVAAGLASWALAVLV